MIDSISRNCCTHPCARGYGNGGICARHDDGTLERQMFTLEDDGWKLVVNGIESGQFTIPGMWNTVNAIYDRRLGAPMYLVFINGAHRRFFVGNRGEWDMFIPSPQALLNWVSR